MQVTRFSSTIIIFLILSVVSGYSQNKSNSDKDTTAAVKKIIELSDIPIRSAELRTKTIVEIKDLISDDAIRRLKSENAMVIASVDPELLKTIDPDDVSKNISFLEYRKVELMIELEKIEEHKSELTQIINVLDNYKKTIIEELELWNNTKRELLQDSSVSGAPLRLEETISFLDSTLVNISVKSTSVMGILDRAIATSSKIEHEIEKTRELILTRQLASFKSDHVPFFRLNFLTNYGKEIASSFRHLTTVDLVELNNYFKIKIDLFAFVFVLLFGFVVLFISIKRSVKIKKALYGHSYKVLLLKVLSHPVSSAIVLTLLITLFLFPDRPLIMRKISFYAAAFPLLHLLSILLEKKFHIYIYAFGVLVGLYMLQFLFLSETVAFRVLLFFIAAMEIAMLIIFLVRYENRYKLNKIRKRILFLFVYMHLLLAAIGLISNLAGRIILTEIVLNVAFFNLFYGLLIYIWVLLINGMIATGIDSEAGQKLNIFKFYGEAIKKKAISFVKFSAVILWVLLALRSFRVSDYIFEKIGGFLTYKFNIFSASFSLDSILILFFVIYISILFANLIRVLLEDDILNRFSFSKGIPHSISMLVKYILVTAGFFLAIKAAGVPIDKIAIILGAMSVGIGFGLQNIFNNLVSGLILLFERPIQLGDTVQVGQLTGNVKSIGLRSSNVTTFEGAEVIVPNGQLVSNEVINWTLSDQKRRIEIIIGVSYKSDPELVYRLLSEILNNHTELVRDPEPLVFFDGLGESSLDFTLLFWIGDYIHNRRIRSEILFSVFRVFKENNIEIPFPQHDIHLRTVDTEILLRNDSRHQKT
jgi:small-conductance mechanosensitive channel